MELGGIRQTEKPRVFLLSSTHGGEAHSLAAARAVISEYRTSDVLGHHRTLVAKVAQSFKRSAAKHRLGHAISIHDAPWRAVLVCRDAEGKPSPTLRTLLLQ